MKADVTAIYAPPRGNILGTDSQGKDIFAQIVHGGRDIIQMALLTGILSTFIGVTLGSLSAVIGGRFDALLTDSGGHLADRSTLPLLAVLATLIQLQDLLALALLLALLSWAGLYRSIRAQVFSIKEQDYVEAAVSLDLGLRHIIFSEILPNMMAYIAMNFTIGMTSAIYAQVGLVFTLGLVPLTRNWGVMINLAWTQGAHLLQEQRLLHYGAGGVYCTFPALDRVDESFAGRVLPNPRLRTG